MLEFDETTLYGVCAVSLKDDAPSDNSEMIRKAREACLSRHSSAEILLVQVGGETVRNQMLAVALCDLFEVVAMESPTYNCPQATVFISRNDQYPQGMTLEGCGFCLPKGPDDPKPKIEAGQQSWNDNFVLV